MKGSIIFFSFLSWIKVRRRVWGTTALHIGHENMYVTLQRIGFQAVYSGIQYRDQRICVVNRVLFMVD